MKNVLIVFLIFCQILTSQIDSTNVVPVNIKVLEDLADRAALTNYYMKKAKAKDLRLISKDSIINEYQENEQRADYVISQLIQALEKQNKVAEFGNRLATAGIVGLCVYTYGYLADPDFSKPGWVLGSTVGTYVITEYIGGIDFFTIDLNPLEVFK